MGAVRGGRLTFEVIPAIDLRGGRCVRLLRGDFDQETRYSDDPVAVARRWEAEGAPWLHVVDLDGARAGAPVQGELMARICRAVAIPVEVSGGLRTMESIAAALEYGATRVQLGSAAIRDPELVKRACAAHAGAMSVAIDTRDGLARADGWESGAAVDALELARRMVDLGVPRLMFTDIARDGTLEGPNLEMLARVVAELPVPVVASGGVGTVEHVVAVARIGCEGVVVGKALYEGAIDLREAIAATSSEFRVPSSE